MFQSAVNDLLRLPKFVKKGERLKKEVFFNQQVPFKETFILASTENTKYVFFYEVDQSAKNVFKLSLHLMDNETKIGLLRIDFNGGHQNPFDIADNLPEGLHQFAGKYFSHNESHIHHFVEGYKTLAWAVPLEDNFPVQSIASSDDVLRAFHAFNAMITLETHFTTGASLI